MKNINCRVVELGDAETFIRLLRDNPEDLLLKAEEDVDLPSDRFKDSIIDRRWGMEWNINNLCSKLVIDHTYRVDIIRKYTASDGKEHTVAHCRFEIELPYSKLEPSIDYMLEWFIQAEERERQRGHDASCFSDDAVKKLADMVLQSPETSDWGLYTVKDYYFDIDEYSFRVRNGGAFGFEVNNLPSPNSERMVGLGLRILDEIRSRGYKAYCRLGTSYREISGGLIGMKISCDAQLKILVPK